MTNTGWRLTAALAPTFERSPEESLRLSEMTVGPGMRRYWSRGVEAVTTIPLVFPSTVMLNE